MKHLQDSAKIWQTTRVQNLLRHKPSRRYYARIYRSGKDVWKSLGTTHAELAKRELEKFLAQQRKLRAVERPEISPRATFSQAVEIHLQRIADAVVAKRVKGSTEHYWRQVFAALCKSWPQLWDRQLRAITKADCEAWARRFVRTTGSATRFNNTVAGLRHVFAIGIEDALNIPV